MINNETVDSADLRHAIEKALDKELLCQQNTGSLGTVTNTSILPGTEYSRPAGESAYDPEGAKELLAQAGYDGETFTPGLHQPAGQPGRPDAAKAGGCGEQGGD